MPIGKAPKLVTKVDLVKLCFKDPALFPKFCKSLPNTLAELGLHMLLPIQKKVADELAALTPRERKLLQLMFSYMKPTQAFYEYLSTKRGPAWP